jgi:hypothetical protein
MFAQPVNERLTVWNILPDTNEVTLGRSRSNVLSVLVSLQEGTSLFLSLVGTLILVATFFCAIDKRFTTERNPQNKVVDYDLSPLQPQWPSRYVRLKQHPASNGVARVFRLLPFLLEIDQ